MTPADQARADRERAEKMLAEWSLKWQRPFVSAELPDLLNRATVAFADVRREAWEEAAKVADEYAAAMRKTAREFEQIGSEINTRTADAGANAVEGIAAALRTLIEGSKP
jgi:hypothetical protein